MKKIALSLIKLLLGLVFLTAAATTQAAETYTLDPSHTYVLWHISHFGFSNPSGKWFANGTLLLDEANPQNSKVNVTINMASIDSGIKELDDHLKGKLFFDVAKYPTATFVSNKVTLTGKNTAKVNGILTLRGIAKPITLDVTLNKTGINPINNKQTAGFSATAQLKRSDFDINALLPGLGDDVALNIETEASKTTTQG